MRKAIQYDGFNIEELAEFMGERDYAVDNARNVFIGSIWLNAGDWIVKKSGRLEKHSPDDFDGLNKKKTLEESLNSFGITVVNTMREFPPFNRRSKAKESFFKRRASDKI